MVKPPPSPLTERECLAWLAAGIRSQEIANHLNVSIKTVEKHIASGRKRLNAATREHAVAIALQAGMINP